MAAGQRAEHVIPKKRETEDASNVEEEEKKESKASIPGFCQGAPVGGRFKDIKGL